MSEPALSGAALAELRAGLDAWAAMVATPEPVDLVIDEEVVLDDRVLPVRRYCHGTAADLTLVWFHGGGYVAGSIDAIDPVCRRLARTAEVTVLSVGYRLAPEHPFPAALDDALAVLASTSGRAAVGGDSAGGGLAAAAARLTTRPLEALVLLCPWLDLTLSSPSALAHDVGLSASTLRAFAAAYADAAQYADHRLSPALEEELTGLPPLVVVVAGNDPLRDEAHRYAATASRSGVRVAVREWPDQEHGFVGQTADNPLADDALAWTSEQLRAVAQAAVD